MSASLSQGTTGMAMARGIGGVADQWQRVQLRLKAELGDTIFSSWLKPLSFLCIRDRVVVLVAPSQFLRDWVRGHYVDQISRAWKAENPDIQDIELSASRGAVESSDDLSNLTDASSPETGGDGMTIPQAATGVAAKRVNGDTSARETLNPHFTFDNFVVGKSNELAHAAARRVAESRSVQFNPLFLYGGVGLGKTHLMHAIAWELRQKNPAARVMYLYAEQFMQRFILALRYNTVHAFKEEFRSVDVLMIDDVQFIGGKNSTQEEFFHTFNALIDNKRQIIISADRSPSDLDNIEERVRSRLGWGLVADIHNTDFELRLGILQSKIEGIYAEHPDLVIPGNVTEFLARRITSNVRELEGALKRVVAFSTLVGRPITLDMADEVLRDLLRANNRRVTVDDIQRKVAEHFNIRVTDMSSPRRARAVARPRQVAMYLSKILTTRSLPEIGRKFGGRDHTTIIYAIKRIEQLIAKDRALADDVAMLRRILSHEMRDDGPDA